MVKKQAVEFVSKDGVYTKFYASPKIRKADKTLTNWQLQLRKAHDQDLKEFTFHGSEGKKVYKRHWTRNPKTEQKFYYYKADK